jgi:hypothetical protein
MMALDLSIRQVANCVLDFLFVVVFVSREELPCGNATRSLKFPLYFILAATMTLG